MRMLATNQANPVAAARSTAVLSPLLNESSFSGKLGMNKPGDHYEQEANRMAEQVLARTPVSGSGDGSDSNSKQSRLRPTGAPSTHAGGQPLDAGTRSFMEAGFHRDFSQIRVHTHKEAASLAGGLNARAFTMGQNIFFGEGQYTSRTREGKRLLAHELTHTVQQQTGATSLNLQRDVVSDVKEKLSYSFTDWAITDSEAMEALALLGSLPPADLPAAVTRLGTKYVDRLLDNLPDDAKTGDVYQRVVRALGAVGVKSYAKEQLEYGFLDWAITDAEVTKVFNLFANFDAAGQEKFLTELDNAGRLGRLIDNSNAGHHALYIRPWIQSLTAGALTLAQRDILRTIVRKTDDAQLETLLLAARKRFNVGVGPSTSPRPGETAVDWDADHLRKTYLTLDLLPEAHVGKNKEFLLLGQFKKAPVPGVTANTQLLTSGLYNPNAKELNINVEAKADDDLGGTIIHETGHAVDREMGWSTGTEPAKPERGGWKVYGSSYHDCASDMVDDSSGAIKNTLTAPQRTDVLTDMETAMSNQSVTTLETNISSHPWFGGLSKTDKKAVLADRALPALGIGLNKPWFSATDGGEHLGPHVYQEGYPNDWCRYRHEARSRMVKPYQFRYPNEWFAEAYALYYTPDPAGYGAKLNAIDPSTKVYFDNFVNTRAPTR